MNTKYDWDFNYVLKDSSQNTGIIIAAYDESQAIERAIQFHGSRREDLSVIKKYPNNREGIVKMIQEISDENPDAWQKTITMPPPKHSWH